MGDLLPANQVILNWNFPIMLSLSGQGEFHEDAKFTEAQIAFVLRQAEEGTPIAEVWRKRDIDATFYNWRKRYGGMMPSEVMRSRKRTTG